MKARAVNFNGEETVMAVTLTQRAGFTEAVVSAKAIGADIRYVDFLYDYFTAAVGDEGYFVWDMLACGTALCTFTARENCEQAGIASSVACYGWNQGGKGILAIVTGMRCDMRMVAGVKDGVYYLYPRFDIDGDTPYEDITVRLYALEDGSYVAMAKQYRAYQMKYAGVTTLKERAEKDARLKKSTEGICVRIRQAWKPVPSPVEYQTPETEPPLTVACTFEQVTAIAEEFHRQGITHAEFCLVGWNKSGHDGAFPQIFPVEPQLGGEQALRDTIRAVQKLGYTIVCHDNDTEAYYGADNFNKNDLVRLKNGSCMLGGRWGGGRSHKICPACQHTVYEPAHLPQIKALGFEGIHYIDVMTIIPLIKCYHRNHPVNRKQAAEWNRKTMERVRDTFGGFSSEGNYDFAAAAQDFALYERMKGLQPPAPADRFIPFFDIVYHGLMLYNLSTETVNYAIKGEKSRLMALETGSRPAVYFYSAFMSDPSANWMGKEDFGCADAAQIKSSVQYIRQMADDYDLLQPERFEFIENHEQTAENVFCTTYANGTKVTVDYTKGTVSIDRSATHTGTDRSMSDG